MDKRYVTIAVLCLLLYGLAGTGAGAVPCTADTGGAVLRPTDTGPGADYLSCMACLKECATRYPPEKYPVANGFCQYSCQVGNCRLLPPVFNAGLPNP